MNLKHHLEQIWGLWFVVCCLMNHPGFLCGALPRGCPDQTPQPFRSLIPRSYFEPLLSISEVYSKPVFREFVLFLQICVRNPQPSTSQGSKSRNFWITTAFARAFPWKFIPSNWNHAFRFCVRDPRPSFLQGSKSQNSRITSFLSV